MRCIRVFLLALLTSFIVCSCFQLNGGSVKASDGINLSGNTVMELTNKTTTLTGDILIRDNATLYVRNSNVTLSMSKSYLYRIRLENSSMGYPRLIFVNSSLSSVRNMFFNIEVYGGFVNFSYVNALATFQHPYFDFFVYTNSNVSLSNSKLNKVNTFNSSIVDISYCNVRGLYSKGNAEIRALKVNYLNGIHAEGESSIFISSPSAAAMSSTREADIYAKGNSTVSISLAQISIGASSTAKIEIFDYGNLTIVDSSISTQYKDILILTHGNSYLSLRNVNIRQAVLSFYDSCVVELNKSTIRETQVFAYNTSQVSIDSSSVDWLLHFDDASNVNISYSNVTLLRGVDSSNVLLANSFVGVLQIRDSCNSVFVDSVIAQVSLEFTSVDYTFSNFSLGAFALKSFKIAGVLFNFTLVNSEIKLGWSLVFHGVSNVTISDSYLWFIGASESACVEVYNSTVFSVPNANGAANLHFISYLDIHVVDLFGNSVSGANVTLSCNGFIFDSKISDENGMVSLTLERWVNASGVFPSSPFNVTVEWDGYQESKYVGLEHEEWILNNFMSSAILASPWWYWYVIYFGVAAACVVAVVVVLFFFKRRKKVVTHG